MASAVETSRCYICKGNLQPVAPSSVSGTIVSAFKRLVTVLVATDGTGNVCAHTDCVQRAIEKRAKVVLNQCPYCTENGPVSQDSAVASHTTLDGRCVLVAHDDCQAHHPFTFSRAPDAEESSSCGLVELLQRIYACIARCLASCGSYLASCCS